MRREVNTRLLCTFRLLSNRWFWRRMHPTITTAWNSFRSNMGIGIRHVRLGACLAHSYSPFSDLSLSLSRSAFCLSCSCLFGFLGFLSLFCRNRKHGNSAFDRVCRNTQKLSFGFQSFFWGVSFLGFLFWGFRFFSPPFFGDFLDPYSICFRFKFPSLIWSFVLRPCFELSFFDLFFAHTIIF